MKKTLTPLTLALACAACQPQASQTATTTAAPSVPAAAARPVTAVAAAPPLPVLFAAADTLTLPMRELLRQCDLSELWCGINKHHRPTPTLEGFFGPDHYRFTVVITEAHRDPQHPTVYQVQGKCRYRKNIRPFTGTLTIRQVVDADAFYSVQDQSFIPVRTDSMSAETWQAAYEKATGQASFYSLRAQLQWQEARAENSGIFEGEAVLNFFVAPKHRVGYAGAPALTEGEPARGSSLLLRGARRNMTTQQVKQFVVADDVFAAAPDVYKDFGTGDRGQEINPKYAKLGWNNYWENDEWWADSPKPGLNL